MVFWDHTDPRPRKVLGWFGATPLDRVQAWNSNAGTEVLWASSSLLHGNAVLHQELVFVGLDDMLGGNIERDAEPQLCIMSL